ncbi:hypothetical protein EVAR_40722_1 [Eumeta japonica]|uniref:Uncharacterized protein n=1 Tax=Eumeta variegata TaxID=151549 RepID=A0A4C1XAL1_EUMVA|nr:hypothetical protein EVAR_40722_1 [Eumeta japonica]
MAYNSHSVTCERDRRHAQGAAATAARTVIQSFATRCPITADQRVVITYSLEHVQESVLNANLIPRSDRKWVELDISSRIRELQSRETVSSEERIAETGLAAVPEEGGRPARPTLAARETTRRAGPNCYPTSRSCTINLGDAICIRKCTNATQLLQLEFYSYNDNENPISRRHVGGDGAGRLRHGTRSVTGAALRARDVRSNQGARRAPAFEWAPGASSFRRCRRPHSTLREVYLFPQPLRIVIFKFAPFVLASYEVDRNEKQVGDWNRKSGRRPQLKTRPALKRSIRSRLESSACAGQKSRTGPEPELKTKTKLGLTTRSFPVKDGETHSMSVWAKPRAES